MTSLSERAEFLIVALVALGPLIASTTIDAVTHTASLSEPRLRMLLAFELPIGAALIAFLRVRGWTASSLGASRPTLKDVLVGLGLAVVLMLSYAILFVIVGSLRPGTQWISIEDLQSAGQPGLRTILAVFSFGFSLPRRTRRVVQDTYRNISCMRKPDPTPFPGRSQKSAS
jgi:hypothetical protein